MATKKAPATSKTPKSPTKAGRIAKAAAPAARGASSSAKSPKKIAKTSAQPKPKVAAAKATAAGLLAVGARAPQFELPDQNGQVLASAALKGVPYVLYFYPKDDTPGCTTEACSFRDAQSLFGKAKVRVIGVSPDSSTRHQNFSKKYNLNFSLLADTEKALAQAYGVWALKQNYGREYMGVVRSTFLIDAKGVVRKAWRGVKVAGHADAVLAEAAAL